jgi:hypothetical protein
MQSREPIELVSGMRMFENEPKIGIGISANVSSSACWIAQRHEKVVLTTPNFKAVYMHA